MGIHHSPQTWRIAFVWQGTCIDVHSIANEQLRRKHGARLQLRHGYALQVRAADDALVIVDGDGSSVVQPDTPHDLGGGLVVLATRAHASERAAGPAAFDGPMFHALMVATAVQACVVSAMVLTPSDVDIEAGAGIGRDWQRVLSAPGGTAFLRNTPVLASPGRAPDEAERPAPLPSSSSSPQRITPAGARLSAEQALALIKKNLGLDSKARLVDAVGDVARSVASAPTQAAGIGGLSPKDPLTTGPGNGTIGAGLSTVTTQLRNQRDKQERKLLPMQQVANAPVSVIDVPDAMVTLVHTDDDALDADVRAHLAEAVKNRNNAVRGCYESWGLAGNAKLHGRIVLQLTLLPSGQVQDVDVQAPPELSSVASCVERLASTWYLGDGLVDAPQRMAFPFLLQPRDHADTHR